MSGGKRDGAEVETHSLFVDEITNRLITLIAPAIVATQTSIDVGGAYFHGTSSPPTTLAQGGRIFFAVVTPWLAKFGPYHERNPDGSRNLLLITGNMPGRCDACRIWQQRLKRAPRPIRPRQLVTCQELHGYPHLLQSRRRQPPYHHDARVSARTSTGRY